jgi:lipopolysaccharide/colanic/teichoic acid biosynthesis glycosyltransferase
MRSAYIKRLSDFIISAIILVVFLPVIMVIALLVRLTMGSPVLFVQKRPGLNSKPFYMYKFRTMLDSKDREGRLLPDIDRLTPVGRFLRASSLDELPELLSVIKGEMSLVGPRPLRMKYLERYTPEQARRHEVKPGVTGWAQVNGRNLLTWEEKFDLDVWYVDNMTLLLDLKILLLTILKVFRREGISAEGHVTATEFLGTKQKQAPPF